MTILIIHPIYVIGTQHTSDLDICFFNKDNLFNQYSNTTNLFLDTIELFKTYLLSKTSIQDRHDNPQLLALTIDYKQHCKNLIHVFFKIITAYQITKIHIYNPHFFDILITELQTTHMLHKLQKYAHMITLFVNKYTWHDTYYSQYLLLNNDNKYNISIEIPYNELNLNSTISIDYETSSTITDKHITITCHIYPFLTSIKSIWDQIITKFIDELYTQVEPTQLELSLQIKLNIYIHLNTTQIQNLVYIANNINTYMPIDAVYLKDYTVDFNTIEPVLILFLIKLKLRNQAILYDYDCSINYFLV